MSNPDAHPTVNEEVTLTFEEGEFTVFRASAVVQAVSADGRLELLLTKELDASRIKPGASVVVEFLFKAATHRMLSSIEKITSASSHEEEERGLRLHLSPPRSVDPAKRREFYRLKISLGLRFRQVRFPGGFLVDARRRKWTMAKWTNERHLLDSSATTEDISGGGLCMASDTPLSRGDELFLEVSLPYSLLRVAGRVVWSTPSRTGGASAHLAGVEFIGLEESKRARLLQFIYKEQKLLEEMRNESEKPTSR